MVEAEEEEKSFVEVKRKTIKPSATMDEVVLSRRFDQKPSLFKIDQSQNGIQDTGDIEAVESMWDKVFTSMVEKGKFITVRHNWQNE